MSMVSGNSTGLEAMATLVYDGVISAGNMGRDAAGYAIQTMDQHPVVMCSIASAALIYIVKRNGENAARQMAIPANPINKNHTFCKIAILGVVAIALPLLGIKMALGNHCFLRALGLN